MDPDTISRVNPGPTEEGSQVIMCVHVYTYQVIMCVHVCVSGDHVCVCQVMCVHVYTYQVMCVLYTHDCLCVIVFTPTYMHA